MDIVIPEDDVWSVAAVDVDPTFISVVVCVTRSLPERDLS